MAQSPPSIDRLLNQVPDSPSVVLFSLRSFPDLASQQDSHGYSLLHAAASYGHEDLLRALVQELHVSPDLLDEDGETCLFVAENVAIARVIVELGVSISTRNSEGQTAAEKLDDEDEQPLVAAYLREATSQSTGAAASTLTQTGGANGSVAAQNGTAGQSESNGVHPPPPMPNGVKINVGTMDQGEAGEEPDAEFRRRIEELAARDDFQGEDGQRELRNLITDAVTGLAADGQGAATRRRLG